MRKSKAAALGLCLLVQLSSAHGQDGVRVDGLVAVIGATAPGAGIDTILRSDVELRARLALARGGADPNQVTDIPASVSAAVLSEIVGEYLIAREARRVQARAPTVADVAEERRRLLRAVGGSQRMDTLLSALSASADELDAIARRRALVGAFLSANLEGALVVTDAELERAQAEQKEAGENPDPSELRAQLSRESFDRAVARWVTVLRARTPMRIYVMY